MKILITSLLILLFLVNIFTAEIAWSQPNVKFAAIGDYGKAGPNELDVSNLVKSWNPEFVITMGDNNYELGHQDTIDMNIGQYYHEFIYPYIGIYGPGDTINRFFPSLGNHDWNTSSALPYLNYFTLPGNERYYDFVKGNIHFFVMDSDNREPDGRDSNSIQGQWLKNKLAQSTSKWNIVYFHHAPYCSNLSTTIMRLPFKRWGAATVLAGHIHYYERLNIENFPYFVNGLGGRSRANPGVQIPGSELIYGANYGAMLISSYNDSLILKFYTIAGELIDNYKILLSQKSLTLTAYIEGFYDPAANSMVGDTVTVFLRNIFSPYTIVDSAKGYLNSSGTGTFSFLNVTNGINFYIQLKHRNSIETWSATSQSFTYSLLTYNFTTAASKAFGNNMIQVDAAPLGFAIYSGDVNQDGFVNLNDIILTLNNSSNFVNGYVITDLNGDNFTNLNDILIAYNNSNRFVSVITPP